MFLSIVIPAYNEGNVIKKNLELINKHFTDKFSFEIIVVNDGSNDDTNSILNQFEKLYDELNNGYEIVIGSRSTNDAKVIISQPFKRVITGKVYNLLVKFVLGLNFKDTQCGFKLFDGNKIRNIINICKINNFSIDVEILYLAKYFNLKVLEKGIVWKNNTFSKVSLIKDPLIMLVDLFRIRFSTYNIKK